MTDVDADGRISHTESFARQRLGDAIVRLYERYAELLPDGPERTRTAAIARAITAMTGTIDLVSGGGILANGVEFVDHRSLIGIGSAHGSAAVLSWLGTLTEVAADVSTRTDDIIDLRADALLFRSTSCGIDRASGGAFERPFISLWIFDAHGLVSRCEQFDADRAADALARFDALTAEPARRVRRVRPNAATVYQARLENAVAARDIAACAVLHPDDTEIVDHLAGTTFGKHDTVSAIRAVLASRDLSYRVEPLATLGDSLALTRLSVSASGVAGGGLDVASPSSEELTLTELTPDGLRLRAERFAGDRLGDAIVRLYERYAELLPEGPERDRAAAIARVVATNVGRLDLERYAASLAPDVEAIDRRTLGLETARGTENFLNSLRSLLEIAPDAANRFDDILALRPDAYLVRQTNFGTDRTSGGIFERPFLLLWIAGADGLIERMEQFDADQIEAAFARWDELTAAPSASTRSTGAPVPPPLHRAAIANDATAFGTRVDEAAAAADCEGLDALYAERVEIRDHKTGRTFSREERLSGFRSLFAEARDPVSRHEPLAVLGRSLALFHRTLAASGFNGRTLDVAAYRIEELCVVEADQRARCTRADLFAVDRLGDAIVRMYERHAEQIPDEPERTRAAAIAGSVAMVLASLDPDSIASALALDVRYADHRALGWGPAHGVVAFVRALRTLRNALPEVEAHTIELLALRADALLVRRTVMGELNASGDRYRRRPIALWVFGANGRVTHWEQFDGDQRAEALARFEELAAPPAPARLVENAATRSLDQFARAWAARDWEALRSGFATGYVNSDRRTVVQLEFDLEQHLGFQRPLFEMKSSRVAAEILATRGDRLALSRMRTEVAHGSIGPSEIASLFLIEADRDGKRLSSVRFEVDALDAAYAELDARYATGEATDHPAMWAALWDVRRALAARDWDRLASLVAPDLVAEDHRLLGWGTAHSAEQYAAALRPLTELQPDVALRLDHLLLRDRAALFVANWIGGEGAGAFEIPVVIVFRANRGGRIDRIHHYALEQIDAARAQFAELAAVPAPSRLVENLATRSIDQFNRAWEMRDLDAAGRVHAAGFVLFDRRSLVSSDADRAGHLETLRVTFELPSSRISSEVLATRGKRLALDRVRFEGTGRSIGPSEIEFLSVVEVDERGARIAAVMFDLDAREAANGELDARYAAGEAAAFPHVAETMRAFREAFARRDWETLAARMAPDVAVEDHRLLGWETVHGAGAYLQTLYSLVDLAPDTRLRLDHVEMSQRGLLWIGAWVGTREGGAFETPWITVSEHDAQGIVLRFDQ